MLTIEKCLVCGSNQFEPFLVCKDHTVSKDNFNIVSCKMCGFKFTNPRPTDLVLGDYYKAEEYVSHTNTKKGIINKLYHIVRNHTLKKKIQLVSSYVSRGTILDFGCGTGMFLAACKEAGWNTIGVDPAINLIEKSTANGVTTISEFFDVNLAKKLAVKMVVMTIARYAGA